jgi:hypothetical protein
LRIPRIVCPTSRFGINLIAICPHPL